MPVDLLVVQHAEKQRTAGDPGLTTVGAAAADRTARSLTAAADIAAVWSSPLRRAVETARPIAASVGTDVQLDDRLRERMNWDGSDPLSDFLVDWDRATRDRAHRPRVGDSSRDAGDRILAAVAEIADSADDGSTVVVVAHGGVTVDALRTLVGDDRVVREDPTLLTDGVPNCAVTRLRRTGDRIEVVAFPTTSPLDVG